MNIFKKFPFKDSPRVAIITCTHIINDNEPILYVAHDADDGCWQFLCGREHDTEDAKVVALEEIYDIDKSIGKIANLNYGWCATRENINDKWNIRSNDFQK